MSDESMLPHTAQLHLREQWDKWWNERSIKNDWAEYVWRQRISIGRVASELGTTPSSLQSTPQLRLYLEQLRGYLESLGHIPRSAFGESLNADALRLVKAAKLKGAKTRTQLSRASALYKAITAHPQKEEIFGVLGMQKGLRHLDDETIIALCAPYDSLSDLKMRNGNLHHEIVGRGLRERVVRTYRWFTYGNSDRAGQQYRSRMELIFANWLSLNGIRFIYDEIVPGIRRIPGQKPLRYDFYLPDYNLFIELLQVEMPGRADGVTRRRQYLENRSRKLEYYAASNLRVALIETEPYSAHDQEIPFAEYSVARLSLELQRELVVPTQEELCYNGCRDLTALSAAEILSTLLKDCRGVADYQNHYSPLRNALKAHPERGAIDHEIQRRGKENREIALAAHRSNRWIPYSEAREFVKKLGLRSEKEFQQWAHHGIPGLPSVPENLPRDSYHVYKRLGGWTTWMDFLGCGDISQPGDIVTTGIF